MSHSGRKAGRYRLVQVAGSCAELRHLHKKPPMLLIVLPKRALLTAVQVPLYECLVLLLGYLRASALQEASAGVNWLSMVARFVLSIQILDYINR